MVHLTGYWGEMLADVGNKPGAQQGDVIVQLSVPVGGVESFTCSSDALTAAGEAGQLITLAVRLEDGRHLLVPWVNVAGIIDAPAKEARRKA
jgi:hypothetical protein